MKNIHRIHLLLTAQAAMFALLLLAGCATVTMSPQMLVNALSYPVAPSGTRVEARVVMNIRFALTPEARGVWRGSYVNDETVANYEQAVATVMANDIRASGIITNLVSGSEPHDFVLSVTSELAGTTSAIFRLHYEIANADGQRVSGRTLEVPIMQGVRTADLKQVLPGAMQMLRSAVLKDIIDYYQVRRQQKERAQIEAIQSASLPDLLASSDRSVGTARERNRALIAAKNDQLPKMLREWKTEQLAAFVVRIEQTILDLNHEAEVANDHAQQATAAGGRAAEVDEYRGLAISYRERIELLKPILAAVRDEMANRNR